MLYLSCTGPKCEGGLAIAATDNALGENSIVLGDNDTGFRQDGDGIISLYSNGSRIGHIDGEDYIFIKILKNQQPAILDLKGITATT
ncbi:hypothetical protein [Escherichia coli]|uniref:hypothetical protein n=1 Tax=Escherichia coli TaxID=562 RepID=UPI003305C6A5